MLVLGIVAALVVGGGIGYSLGKGTNNNEAAAKDLQDSITMMKDQSTTIQKMAEMMKLSGAVMQEMGIKYHDNEAVSDGKDLEMMGGKYIKEDTKASEGSEVMKEMMGN